MIELSELKVALVHDWIAGWGGAEQVLLAMESCFPGAPIYTAVYDPEVRPDRFASLDIRTSFVQRLPGALKNHRRYLPLMPLAFEHFDLRDYDVVLSSSHACAKGVITGPNTLHISYVHTPIRYAWDMYHDYMSYEQPGKLKRVLMHGALHYLRAWDALNTQRVDHLLCNSRFVQRRIHKFYRRDAHVLYPPVQIPEAQHPLPGATERDDFYLVVGRLVHYKRVDLVIEAFRRNGKRLIIVGDGPQREQWIQNLPEQITYLGNLDRPRLEQLYTQARALIFPPLEDFGMVPVEAQGFGCPVIAYGKGGALDSIKANETGLFFAAQTAASLNEAIERFERQSFDAGVIRQHAQHFNQAAFTSGLKTYVRHQWRHFNT